MSDDEQMRIDEMKREALRQLQIIKEQGNVTSIPSSKEMPSVIPKKIPFLSRIIKDFGKSGYAIDQLSKSISAMSGSEPSQSLSTGLQIGTLSLAVLDFLLIPLIYLAAYILNEKAPFTLKDNTKWLYSALLLALTIIALAIPPVATTIALVAAGFSFGVSVFVLGQVLHERYQVGKERKVIRTLIASAEDEMRLIYEESETLKNMLLAAQDEADIIKINQSVALLLERYAVQKNILCELKEKELRINQKIEAIGLPRVLGKSFAVGLGALTVAGLVVSLFFPPVGMVILTSVASISLAYVVTRFTVVAIQFLRQHLSVNPVQPVSMEHKSIDDLEETFSNGEDSTASIVTHLSKTEEDAMNALKGPQYNKDEELSVAAYQSFKPRKSEDDLKLDSGDEITDEISP